MSDKKSFDRSSNLVIMGQAKWLTVLAILLVVYLARIWLARKMAHFTSNDFPNKVWLVIGAVLGTSQASKDYYGYSLALIER